MNIVEKKFKIGIDSDLFYKTYCKCSSPFYRSSCWVKKADGKEMCQKCIENQRDEKINQIVL